MKPASKTRLTYGMILLCVAAIYNVLLFAIKQSFGAANWIGYGFTMLSFVLLYVDAFLPRGKFSRFPMFGVSLSVFTLTYFLIQILVCGIVLMFFNDFSTKAMWAIEAVLLLLYIIAFGLVIMGKQIISGQDDRIAQKVVFVKGMLAELEVVRDKVPAGETASAFEALLEEIRFSDPMSSDSLAPLEERIRMKAAVLRDDLEMGHSEKTAEYVGALRQYLRERNSKCLLLKR